MDNIIDKISKGESKLEAPTEIGNLAQLSAEANTLYYKTFARQQDHSIEAQVERRSFYWQYLDKTKLLAWVLEAELLMRQAAEVFSSKV